MSSSLPPPRITARGPVTVETSSSPAALKVGETLNLDLRVLVPPGWRLESLDWGAAGPAWKIQESGPVAGGARARLEYDPLAKDPKAFDWGGPATLRGPVLHFRDPSGQEISFPLEDITVDRLSLIQGQADPSQLSPLRPPRSLPGIPSWAWPVLALILAAGAYAALRKKKRAPAIPPGPPPLSPFEAAWKALDQLSAEGLLERGELETFVDRLSNIIRVYLEGRFGLKAPERTTEEFLEEARNSPSLSAGHKDLLGRFLERADLVKFAKARPSRGELELFLESARGFLTETGRG